MEEFTCNECKKRTSLGVHLPDENKSICLDCAQKLIKKLEGEK